jgi:hypothetical protein
MDAILTIVIKTENDAFAGNPSHECARILRQLADKMEESGLFQVGLYRQLLDINGNVVGLMEIEDAN